MILKGILRWQSSTRAEFHAIWVVSGQLNLEQYERYKQHGTRAQEEGYEPAE